MTENNTGPERELRAGRRKHADRFAHAGRVLGVERGLAGMGPAPGQLVVVERGER